MMYCHRHDRHFDSDYYTECPECEDEAVESWEKDGAKTISIHQLEALKDAHAEAELAGLETFEFQGKELLTAYAKYVIEYYEQHKSKDN